MYRKVAANVCELIGNTPFVRLNRVGEFDRACIIAKLESFNPGGSVKDRICLAMIKDAEDKGIIRPPATIVEPTSGNTGIGLAMVAAVKGYRCILTMPESMSVERVHILRAYGVEVVLTPAIEGMPGAIRKAQEIVKMTPNSFMPQQFSNKANPQIHRETTAREIIAATRGKIDVFVSGVGTGGTITGVGEVLKRELGQVKIVAVEPRSSPVLSGGAPGPHKIQGIGAGFVPEILNMAVIDQIIPVEDQDAFDTARELAQKEGLLVGISSGAAAWASLRLSAELGQDKTIVVVFPDSGERYFSMAGYFDS